MTSDEAERLLAEMTAAADLINRGGLAIETLVQAEVDRTQGLSKAQALALGLALVGSGGMIIKRWCSNATAAEVAYAVADALAAGGDLRLSPADFSRLVGIPEDLESGDAA